MGLREAGVVTLATIAIAGCADREGAASEPERTPVSCAGKPQAPVDLALHTVEVTPGRYRLVAEATPSVEVDRLAVVLLPSADLSRARAAQHDFGATEAGTPRTTSFDITLRTGGARLEVSARVWLGGIAPSVVERTSIGSPAALAAPAVRTIALPSGGAIDEVGP